MRKRSRRFALLSLIAGASVVSGARAESDDKLFLEFGAGVGLNVGRHHYGSTYYPNQTTRMEEAMVGPVVAATLTPAYAWSNFAVGIAFDASFALPVNGSCYEPTAAASAIAMTRTRSGFGGAIALGYASAGGGCSSDSVDYNYPDGFVPTDHKSESMTGPRAAARFGYIWPLGVGFYTTASYAYLTGDNSSYAPLTLVVQAMLSGW
jgi:hypothetical protein